MTAKSMGIWALAGACALAFAGAAWADDIGGEDVTITPGAAPEPEEPESENDFTRDGWYLGAWAVYSVEDFQKGFDGQNDWGFGIHAGYLGWRMFSGELQFEMVPNQRASAGQLPGNTFDINLRHFTLALDFKAYPLNRVFDPASFWSRFQPFVSAGVGWTWADERWRGIPDRQKGGFTAPLGGGIDWYLTNNLVLTTSAAYVYNVSTDVEQWRHLSARAGLKWRFTGGGEF